MSEPSFHALVALEFERLGLHSDESPYDGMASDNADAAAQFLAHLRALPGPATWRAVFPELPAHWDLDDPETWTCPYRPIGPFDYQSLPTGPYVMIAWPSDPGKAALTTLLTDARAAGFQVYGAGWVLITNPEISQRPARIVLDHATNEVQLQAFTDWIHAHPIVEFQGIGRNVDERYAPEAYP